MSFIELEGFPHYEADNTPYDLRLDSERRLTMRHFLILVSLFTFLGCSGDVRGAQSSFGFSIKVPDNWLVLTRQEVKDNPDLFENVKINGMSPELMQEIMKKIRSGSIEFYFRQGTEISSFNDNINVVKEIRTIPSSTKDLAKVCEALPGQFKQMFGRPLEFHACEFAEVADRNAIYLEFEGVAPNTRSMQYQVAKSNSVILIITATCREKTLSDVRAEFGSMIKSMRFD